MPTFVRREAACDRCRRACNFVLSLSGAAAAGLLACAAPCAVAQTPDGQAEASLPEKPQVLTPLQGPLLLNGRLLGDIEGAVSADGDGVLPTARLQELLKPVISPESFAELQGRIAGRERAPIGELSAEGFQFRFDPTRLEFHVETGFAGLAEQSLSLQPREVPDPAQFDQPARFSAGLNVTAAQSYDHAGSELRDLEGAIDLIANYGGFGGVTLTAGVDYDQQQTGGNWRRREVRLTKDVYSSALRFVAGEFAPAVDGFQTSSRVLGFSVTRAYSSIRPFENIRPGGRREFLLDRESFVDVEVNGVVVERLRLPPGRYSMADFPYGEGANIIRLLVDDQAGRREVAEFSLFGGGDLLQRGVMDFGFAAGMVEADEQLTYGGDLGVSGYLRRGLTDNLTVALNAQAVGSRAQAGVAATLGTAWGVFDVEAAVSQDRDAGRSGAAAAVTWLREFSVFEANDLRVYANWEAFSEEFQGAFGGPARNQESWRAATRIVARLPANYTVTAGAAITAGRGGVPDQRTFDLGVGKSFGRFGLNATFGREETEGGRTVDRVALGLTARLGPRSSLTARYESASRFREVGYTRTSSGDLGDLSGSVRLSEDRDRQAITGDARYIHNRFEAQLVHNRLVATAPGGRTAQDSRWRISTFLGYAGGAFGVGRPAQEGFVVVPVHDSLAESDVSISSSGGRTIARGGLFGPALVPLDRAYAISRFDLNVDPLPPGYDIGAGVISVFPGFGSGYRQMAGSDASRVAMGVLIGPDGPLSLVGGVVEPVDGKPDPRQPPREFFTNRAGRFVADRLAPGRYRLVVGGSPIAEFELPPDAEGTVDVGTITAKTAP